MFAINKRIIEATGAPQNQGVLFPAFKVNK